MTKTPLALLLASVLMSSAVVAAEPKTQDTTGTLNVTDDIELNNPQGKSIGLTASGPGAIITLSNHSITGSANEAIGANAQNGGAITLTNATLVLTSQDPNNGKATGLLSSDKDSHITMTGGKITADANLTVGAQAIGGKIDLQDVDITINNLMGGIAVFDDGIINANKVTININAKDKQNPSGVLLETGVISLEDSTITVEGQRDGKGLSGRTPPPVDGHPKGQFSDKRSTFIVKGESATGLNFSNVNVNLKDTIVTTEGENSKGITFTTDSLDGTVNLIAEGLTLTANGTNASALEFGDGGTLKVQNSKIMAPDGIAINMRPSLASSTVEVHKSTVDSGNETISLLSPGKTVTLFGTTTSSKSNVLAKVQSPQSIIQAKEKSQLNGVTQLNQAGELTIDLSNSQWTVGGDATVSNLTLDAGGVVKLSREMEPRNQGNTLTVTSRLDSNDGTIELRTVLGDDNSVTDHLVIDGMLLSNLIVDVHGEGSGAETQNGIELITINGGTFPDATIRLKSKPRAGQFIYDLVQGEGPNKDKWFLKSSKILMVDVSDVVFVPTHLLWGELDTRDARTGGLLETSTGLWVRSTGEYVKDKSSRRAKIHDLGLQVGFDQALNNTWSVSLVGDVGRAKADFDKSEHDAKNRRWGVGAIATRTANDTYVEVATHFTQDRFTLNNGVDKVKVRGHQWLMSIEAGHRFTASSVYVEPQVQIAYVRTHLKDYAVGAKTVQTDTLSGVGARLSLKVGNETPVASWWARADLLPRFGGKASMTVSEVNFDPVTVEEKTSGMGVGLALGGNVQLAPMWSLSANLQATKHHHLKPGFMGGITLKTQF